MWVLCWWVTTDVVWGSFGNSSFGFHWWKPIVISQNPIQMMQHNGNSPIKSSILLVKAYSQKNIKAFITANNIMIYRCFNLFLSQEGNRIFCHCNCIWLRVTYSKIAQQLANCFWNRCFLLVTLNHSTTIQWY